MGIRRPTLLALSLVIYFLGEIGASDVYRHSPLATYDHGTQSSEVRARVAA